MKFRDFQLNPELLEGIEALGFEEATPIQAQAIPIAVEGKDLIACAQTGTGKTAAYLIPVIHNLAQSPSDKSRVLIIAPTRELVTQIEQNVDALSYFTGVSCVSIFGGGKADDWERQKNGIDNGVDILIATPGRFKMHLSLGYLSLDHIETVILDEADKMLDMGFYDDIIQIVSKVPDAKQSLMFSATMPPKIRDLARKIMKSDPEEISLNLSKPAEGIDLTAFSVYDEQKIPMLEHLLKTREVESMIIFASSKLSVDQITRSLKKLKYPADYIHSDKEQADREKTLRAFKNREFSILVGTDVLSRGIDIDNLSHVLNFDVPNDAEDYVHRVGRTARAKSTGEAITFINPRDQRKMIQIERLIQREVPKLDVPEELGETPSFSSPARRKKNPRNSGRSNRSDQGRKKSGNNSGPRNNNRYSKPGNSSRNRKDNNQRPSNRRNESDRPRPKRNHDEQPRGGPLPGGYDPALHDPDPNIDRDEIRRNNRKRRRPHKRPPSSGGSDLGY